MCTTIRKHPSWSCLVFAVAFLIPAPAALAADLDFGVYTVNNKVRPADHPQLATQAILKAARNEFEAFQVVFYSSGGDVRDVSVHLSKPLSSSGAQIPAANVVLYRAEYYDVGTASNTEGAPGLWPDPLIPDVDVYYGEKRNAFPFTVPQGQSRAVWVDVLVPIHAAAGDYSGELQVLVGSDPQGIVPIHLRVGNFTLPSTATLKSAFALDYSEPCMAHTGTDTCDSKWNEEAALTLRELYVRSALEHRFTIHEAFFQPPMGGSIPPFERIMLPHFNGTGKSRLPGARVTTVRMDTNEDFAAWITYAKKQGFADRLFYYPIDEPGVGGEWDRFKQYARSLRSYDPNTKVILTTSMHDAEGNDVLDDIDIFVPVINQVEERPNSGTPYDGNQRANYDSWLKAKSGRELWAYQSCMSHGCGDCGEPSPGKSIGWPDRVIDSSAVQNRAFPWIAFIFDIEGELYFNISEQLRTAWESNGQCKFSGSGDGTIYYPGTPARIGGTKDIPVESIRVKMIREGMEDYEYLTLVAKRDRSKAMQIAKKLFPYTYATDKSPAEVEQAREQLFDLLDQGGPPAVDPPPYDPTDPTDPTDPAGTTHAGNPSDPSDPGISDDATDPGAPLSRSRDISDGDNPPTLMGGCALAGTMTPRACAIPLLSCLCLIALLRRRRRR